MKARMLPKGRITLLFLALCGAAALWLSGAFEYLTFENLKESRDLLRSLVAAQYALSVAAFIVLVVATAFFLPGAIVLTIAGGVLFGVVRGTLYLLAGATGGATLAFLSARYVLGAWFQDRYAGSLQALNDEIRTHGQNYLAALRIVPVMPFFLVNYLAGITNMPLRTFLWTTAAGMLPGTLIYTFAGRELGSMESPDEILSPRMLLALALLALFALLPALLRFRRKGRAA